MNKTILAVVIPALVATSAQAVELYKTDAGSVDFYGQLRTELKKTENKAATLGAGSSRAGVTAQYDVNDRLYVHGKYEFGLKEDELTGRLHYAGFGGSFGEIAFGKQWMLQEDLYGADFSYFYGGSVIRYVPISGGLHDNLIKYNYEADNFSLNATYGLDEDNSAPTVYELFATADVDQFDLILGVANEKMEFGADKLTTSAYTASLGYQWDTVYLQGTYYRADYDLRLSGSKSSLKEDTFAVAATWDWQNNATAYTGIEFGSHDDKALENSTLFYVGSDYHFNDWSRIYIEMAYGDGSTLGYQNKESELVVKPDTYDSEFMYAVGYRVYW